MRRPQVDLLRFAVAAMVWFGVATFGHAQQPASNIAVFYEDGFPTADTAPPSRSALVAALSRAQIVGSKQLDRVLQDPATGLLVLPFGSAFPETSWPAIHGFLERGGNLLVIGGRPFLRAAYLQGGKWQLRDESVRFTRELFINDYWPTPGSAGLEYAPNTDLPLDLPRFEWTRAFSPIIRLSVRDVYPREGSTGALDARLETLVWGDRDHVHLAAPVIQIDHLQNAYTGSRWIFVECELGQNFWQRDDSKKMAAKLAERALRGSEELTFRPRVPLFLPGESLRFHVALHGRQPMQAPRLAITVIPEDDPSAKTETSIVPTGDGEVMLPAPPTRGFHAVEARFYDGQELQRTYRSGFWVRDDSYLRSGPRLGVNADYFELDGKPLPVVGTTYMSSEVQRQYFSEPNAYVWDRDMAQIEGNGLNMIRTGWWTDWAKVVNERGEVTDEALRSLEALLMTARRHKLAVQFTFFAFLPEVLGGENGYFDPAAIARQRKMVETVVRRFKDVPFLAYDLINEPSFSKHTWTMRPNGDNYEQEAWNQWISRKYPDRAALMDAWNLPFAPGPGGLPLPSGNEFNVRSEYDGHNSLKIHDFYRFAQESFAAWVARLRQDITQTGSKQLVTVGQDEGGVADRLSPAFFAKAIDFTTTHSWWQNNDLLWTSLMAKQPGKAMLVQETGLQRELTLDERARRTAENEAALFERKVTTSFIQGAGALEWLWNVNTYMTSDNEVPIGAVRVDGTMKPEGMVLRDISAFVRPVSEHFHGPQLPEVAIVTSQALQHSVLNWMANQAQQRAIRALMYHARIPAYVVAENQIAALADPRLVIVPSPQALEEPTWAALQQYVQRGGTLLLSGPVERDEHFHRIARATKISRTAEVQPLTFSQCTLRAGNESRHFQYDLNAQNLLEWISFDGRPALQEFKLGRGTLLWASCPMESSDDLDSIAAVYSYAAGVAKVRSTFEVASGLPTSVLVYPQILQESTLYVVTSESATEEPVSIKDRSSGAEIKFVLPPQRAAMAVIRRSDGKLLGKYGF